MRLAKAWTAIDKADLSDTIKRNFSQAVVVLIREERSYKTAAVRQPTSHL